MVAPGRQANDSLCTHMQAKILNGGQRSALIEVWQFTFDSLALLGLLARCLLGLLARCLLDYSLAVSLDYSLAVSWTTRLPGATIRRCFGKLFS